jgi:secondary thiamine-phosphate synthase enzyme
MRGALSIATTPAGSLRTHSEVFEIETAECLQFIDITEAVELRLAAAGVQSGLVNIQSAHTTAAILVNENEPLLIGDMKRTLERLAPRGDSYQHDDFSVRTANLTPDERPNGHAHCKAMFLRTAETLNVRGGRLQFGPWQRVFLVELDDARRRKVFINVLGLPFDEME